MSSIKFTTQIDKWGDSDAIRIPKPIMKKLNLRDKQQMEIIIKDDAIVFTPVTPKNIHELFKDWHDDGKRDTELDWGHSQINELKW